MSDMRRREFIALLGGAAAVWPLAASAQPAMPVIGFLSGTSSAPFAHLVVAYRQGLREMGYVEGRNLAIEFRWAEGQYDRLPDMAADLVRRQVAVITTTGGDPAALAAKAATTIIPIVFTAGTDPVKSGLVASLNRPGGNVTGVHILTAMMEGKRQGLLRELVPTVARIAVLLNPTYTAAEVQLKEVEEAARTLGLETQVLHASTELELDTTFATLGQLRVGALQVCADPSFNSRRDHIVALAARHAIPAIYEQREFAVAGGLASYGTSLNDAYYQLGIYTGRVLNGDKPADLPVMQSTKYEFIINLKTAKSLGLEIPPTLLARADEVIE
jgi:putative tryptophan/tyrosine transport system substrate-binding protein